MGNDNCDPPTPIPKPTPGRREDRSETSRRGLLGTKNIYKLWVFAAVVLLAFWSMFTGSVTLKWSAGGHLSDDFGSRTVQDLDVLEVEEREKLVRHMWDLYTHSNRARLTRFWVEAFRAAYEQLSSEVSGVKEAAISEIAMMSLRSFTIETNPLRSKSRKGSRKIKEVE